MKPRVAVLGTYPPTQCGIATFTQSLVNAMLIKQAEVGVVRLVDAYEPRPSSAVIHQHINGQGINGTANVMNRYDAVIVQHEFGIYGGSDGEEVLELLERVHVPKIVVLHTVLRDSSRHQREVMQGLLDLADVLVTMTNTAREALIADYQVNPKKVFVIPHGSADLRAPDMSVKKSMRPTILTWGLISQGKGIEWGIEALAQLGDLSPRPRYVVAGQTHPKVLVREGERYRNQLLQKATRFGVEDDVIFVDRYLDSQSLKHLVQAADIVLLPYDSHVQATSGVLVEALVAGKPIVATRFPHSLELLGDGTGELVNQCDPNDMAQSLRRIFTDIPYARKLRSATAHKTPKFLWSTVGQDYLKLVNRFQHPVMGRVKSEVVGR